MKLLKDTIEEALALAGQIVNDESRESYERELWLHITGILSLQKRLGYNRAQDTHPDIMGLLLLNPACPFYTDFKRVFMSLDTEQKRDFEEVEVY